MEAQHSSMQTSRDSVPGAVVTGFPLLVGAGVTGEAVVGAARHRNESVSQPWRVWRLEEGKLLLQLASSEDACAGSMQRPKKTM